MTEDTRAEQAIRKAAFIRHMAANDIPTAWSECLRATAKLLEEYAIDEVEAGVMKTLTAEQAGAFRDAFAKIKPALLKQEQEHV